MNRRAFFLLILFGITFFILLFLSLFLLVKRHTQSKDSKFLTNLKLFLGLEQEKDSISQYFNNADKILRYFLKNSSNYKYELPWYISFGTARAGKTSFFANVPLDTPVQLNYSDTAYINHYFFNEGIVLDIKSELIFNDSSHNFSWDRLLSKLKDIRPMKCIDGIVYFVSLRDLLSKDPDVILQNKKDIEVLYQKLWKLQNKFEMRLPIYMVFTHLDALPGFSDFISLFNSYSSDIFGWSNPFSLDAKFSIDLLNNMKNILDEELKVLLAEVMVNFPAEVSFNIMNFINSFQDIYPIISEHLSLIFQNNKYTSGLYLRGVYFTAIDSQTSSFEKIPYLKNEDADLEGGHTIVQSNIFFAKDLLVKKIFAEKNIGKDSVDKKIVSKQLKVFQLGYSAFSIAALSYSVSLYRDLTFVQESLFPKYLKISEALREYDSDKNYVNRRGFIEELKLLLLYLGDASNYHLFFTGVPSSYFSSVDHAKINLILLASKKLVLTTLFNDIESKFIKLSNSADFSYTVASDTYSFINPLHSNEFRVLKDIVSIVAEIEQYEQKFLFFKEHNSVSSLGWLLENILNIKMPESFEKNIMHSSKMDLVDLDISKMFNHKKKIKKKFRLCLNKFIINCFSKDKISQYFFELERLLFLIDSRDDKLSYDNLQSLQKYISDLVTLFNDSEFDWLKSKHFSSKEFDSLLKDIESSSLLGGEDTVTELLNRTSTSYHSFKNSLGCYQLPLIGSPFYTIDNFKIQLSQSILELQGVLNDIFSESFMESVPKKNIPHLNLSQAVFWDVNSIKNILSVIKDYNVFESKISSQSTSSKIDLIIGRIAQKNLRDLIQFKMLDSHKVVGLNLNNAHLADFADNVKNTFEEISEIFKFLSKIDIDFFRDLKDLQKSSLLNFLTYIDRAMQMENLYDIKEDMFLLDSNNKKLYFSFNLNDYLSSQKKHIEFFSSTLATYVLAGLDNIAFLDNTMPDPLVIKWKDIAKNLEDYKSNTSNSQLFLLEELASKIQRSPLNDLFQKDLRKIEANLNKDSFFETKLFILTQRLNSVLDSSISRLLVVQYEVALAFYKEYSYAFPFDMNGPLVGVAGYNKMQEVIKKQQEIIDLVHMIKPNYDSPVFRFVANLGKLSRMISFLMSSEECLVLNFKAYQSIGDLYEKNLNLVVGCSAKVNGQKPLNLYKNGQLKIYDVVEFEISLAKNCGKKISKINKDGYLVFSNSLRLSFDKYQLMRFLMENSVEVNNSLFIRFTIEIEDDKGIKDSIVIMIPVELCLDGVKFEMPDKSFTKISEELK